MRQSVGVGNAQTSVAALAAGAPSEIVKATVESETTGPLLSTKKCADHLGCSKSWLDKKRVDGDGPPFIRVGSRMIRYDQRVVDKWVGAQTYRSTSEPPRPAGPAAP